MLSRFRKKRNQQRGRKGNEEEYAVISVSVDDVREAVNKYARSLAKGISLRNLVGDNNEIDLENLYKYLGGKPDKLFYMSKETFEVFDNETYPKYIDICQVAYDQYVRATGDEPIIDGNPHKQISYFKLRDYLQERPPIDLYVHPKDQMVTHRIIKDDF